jgi:hypothetical protein
MQYGISPADSAKKYMVLFAFAMMIKQPLRAYKHCLALDG